MKRKTEFKIKGTHRVTFKDKWFTVKDFSYNQALAYLIGKHPDYQFPELYE